MLYLVKNICSFLEESPLSTLDYYDRYRTLALQRASLESMLRTCDGADYDLLAEELANTVSRMDCIEADLARYIPFDLPPRVHYRAMEEREFLYLRCIKGLTLMKTAELLNVSRDTVYRIRRRLARAQGASFSFDYSS